MINLAVFLPMPGIFVRRVADAVLRWILSKLGADRDGLTRRGLVLFLLGDLLLNGTKIL